MANTLTNAIPVMTGMVVRALMPYLGALDRWDASFNPGRGWQGDTIRVPLPDEELAARKVTPGVTPTASPDIQPTRTVLQFDKDDWIEVPFTLDDFDMTTLVGNFRSRQADAAAYRLMLEVEERTLRTAVKGTQRAVSRFDSSVSEQTANASLFGLTHATTRHIPLQPVTRASEYLTAARAPMMDRHIILDDTRYHAIAALPEFNRVDWTGDTSAQRAGVIGNKLGWTWHMSQGVGQLAGTASTATGRLVNDASLDAGETSVAFNTGSGGFINGEAIGMRAGTAGGPTRTYVVDSTTSTPLTLRQPLVEGIADNAPISLAGATAPRGIALHREFMLFGSKFLPDSRDGVANSMTREVGPLRIRVVAERQSNQTAFTVQCAIASAVHRKYHGVQIVLS